MSQGRILEQGTPLAVAGDLRGGAAHVQVDPGKAPVRQKGGGPSHVLRHAAKDLGGQEPLPLPGPDQVEGGLAAEAQRLGADHLGNRGGATLFAAKRPEGAVRHPRHGREPKPSRGHGAAVGATVGAALLTGVGVGTRVGVGDGSGTTSRD